MPTLYTHRNTIFTLDNVNKRYILTINDLPNEEKPREKLISLGPKSLTSAELLAVVLNTGTIKEDVLSMSSRVMKEYGEKSIMSVRNVKKLSEDLDIPLVRAGQIVACAELGRRFYEKNYSSTPTIRTASDVHAYVKDMYDLPKEHLRGLYLNSHFKLIHDEIISIGTVDTNIIHPREVFKPAFEYGAVAMILVHNHPSGIVEPSEADVSITNQLVEAGRMLGIDFIDHIIVTKESFSSIPINYTK